LGERPALVVQTRNGQQLQHIYLRFPLDESALDSPGVVPGAAARMPRNRPQPKRGAKDTLQVDRAAIKLTLTAPKSPAGATLRVYGLNSQISNIWPEQRIVWGNSLSETGLEDLPLLAQIDLSGDSDSVTLSSEDLALFLSQVEQPTVTFVITGEHGNAPITFASKEQSPKKAPELILNVAE